VQNALRCRIVHDTGHRRREHPCCDRHARIVIDCRLACSATVLEERLTPQRVPRSERLMRMARLGTVRCFFEHRVVRARVAAMRSDDPVDKRFDMHGR
jgi:hypothetical protein